MWGIIKHPIYARLLPTKKLIYLDRLDLFTCLEATSGLNKDNILCNHCSFHGEELEILCWIGEKVLYNNPSFTGLKNYQWL